MFELVRSDAGFGSSRNDAATARFTKGPFPAANGRTGLGGSSPIESMIAVTVTYRNTDTTSHAFAALIAANSDHASAFTTGPFANAPISRRSLVNCNRGQIANGS